MKKKLLHIDASKSIRKLLARMLGTDFEIRSCGTLAEAEDALKKETPDLIISDLLLDRGSGLDFILHVRSYEKTATVPVILMSAVMNPFLSLKAVQAGANLCISKMFTEKEILTHALNTVKNPKKIMHVEIEWADFQILQWREGSRHYRYSPDLHLKIEAQNGEKADRLIFDALQESTLADPEIALHGILNINVKTLRIPLAAPSEEISK